MTFVFIGWAALSAAAAVAQAARAAAQLSGREGQQARDRVMYAVRHRGHLGYALLTMLPVIAFPPAVLMRPSGS